MWFLTFLASRLEAAYGIGSGRLASGRCTLTIIHDIPRRIDGSHSMTIIRDDMVWSIAVTTAAALSLQLEWLWALILTALDVMRGGSNLLPPKLSVASGSLLGSLRPSMPSRPSLPSRKNLAKRGSRRA